VACRPSKWGSLPKVDRRGWVVSRVQIQCAFIFLSFCLSFFESPSTSLRVSFARSEIDIYFKDTKRPIKQTRPTGWTEASPEGRRRDRPQPGPTPNPKTKGRRYTPQPTTSSRTASSGRFVGGRPQTPARLGVANPRVPYPGVIAHTSDKRVYNCISPLSSTSPFYLFRTRYTVSGSWRSYIVIEYTVLQ
jgi:hypothetical protein